VLQADKAYWFKIINQQQVACYQEYIPGDWVDRRIQCPWIKTEGSSEPHQVALILDTTLDEVDRVDVARSDHVLVNRYRQLMTLTRLRRDYPQSGVYALPEGNSGSMAALVHPAIPESWSSWLARLQTVGLVFHQVVTASELAAHRSRQLCGPVLLLMRVASYERHLLVQRGVMQFLRTVSVNARQEARVATSESPDRAAVEQSLEYLSTVLAMDVSAIRILQPRSAPAATKSDADIDTRENADPEEEQVDVLLAMFLALHIEYDVYHRNADSEKMVNTHARVGQSGFHKRSSRVVHLGARLLAGFPLRLCKTQQTSQWSIRRSVLRWLDVFEPSLRYANSVQRVALTVRASILFAVLAILAASGALLSGVAGNRLIHHYAIQKAGMHVAESEIQASAAAAFTQPRVAADSLFIADELSNPAWSETQSLLGAVATVITAMPGVQLEQLVWTLVEHDEPYESMTHTLDSASHRQTLSRTSRDVAVQLELSGTVPGDSLKARQTVLEKLVKKLWRLPGVINARVLESPLDTALSSQIDADSPGQYRVSLIMGEP